MEHIIPTNLFDEGLPDSSLNRPATQLNSFIDFFFWFYRPWPLYFFGFSDIGP
jgi:hypothetical protein